MSIYVGGYYLTFVTIRVLMAKLGIDDRNVDEHFLEFPINNWLNEQGKFDMLAGAIAHPQVHPEILGRKEDGILLITHIKEAKDDYPNLVIQENGRDLQNKQWLVTEGGVGTNQLEWMALRDNFDLTLNGPWPKQNEIRGPQTSQHSKVLSPEQVKRWLGTNLNIEDFLVEEEVAGRWPPK